MSQSRLPLPRSRSIAASLGLIALAADASAQGFNNPWVTYAKAPAALTATGVSSSSIEVDFTPGDLNLDGWTDLLVMRKEPFTKAGKRTQLLLMNESGVLVDRTSQYATASDFAGDQGFLTPTSTRHSVIVDVNNDGWPDVVTATAMGNSEPKYVSHPRVYINRKTSGGTWLGLRHEQARIPQLFVFGSGNAGVPHFTRVLAGDVNGDGSVDLYFVDHDDGVGGYNESSSVDLQDRLLINDGAGNFTDQTLAYMTVAMVDSTFGTSGAIVDLNGDGKLDIVKNDTNGPNNVAASYHAPANPSSFNIFDEFYTAQAPYFMDLADLNNDGRLDVIAGDDGADKLMYHQGTDALGRVIWSPPKSFQFLSGSEGEFTGQIHSADLNNDGWTDVLICDMDVDVASGSGHRTHIYHNPGGTPGSYTITPIEERKSSSTSSGNWIGVVGMEVGDLTDAFDLAVFDLDRDGDQDIVMGRSAGTTVWKNQLDPGVCQESIGYGGPGMIALSACGQELATGGSATLTLSGAPPAAQTFLAAGLSITPTPIFGGTLAPFPIAFMVGPLLTDSQGKLTLSGIPGGGGPFVMNVQALVVNLALPMDVAISNALALQFLP